MISKLKAINWNVVVNAQTTTKIEPNNLNVGLIVSWKMLNY